MMSSFNADFVGVYCVTRWFSLPVVRLFFISTWLKQEMPKCFLINLISPIMNLMTPFPCKIRPTEVVWPSDMKEAKTLTDVEQETIRQESSVLNRKLYLTGGMLCSSHYLLLYLDLYWLEDYIKIFSWTSLGPTISQAIYRFREEEKRKEEIHIN